MMLRSAYRYVAEAAGRDGRRIGELLLTPDFAPAAEWAHLEGVRAGVLPALAHHGPGTIEPVYDRERARPYLEGFRLRFDAAPDPAQPSATIPWSYFQTAVEASAATLVERGKLAVGESFVYRVCAFPDATAGSEDCPAGAPTADEEPVRLSLTRRGLNSMLTGATRLGTAVWHADDLPVVVHRSVLAEASALARAANEQEVGGALVGHVRQDTASPEICVEVTAQIAAREAPAGPAHLSFTPETWSTVSDAMALRRHGEILVGWWHFHPFFCRRCDPARRTACAFSRPFFSRDDRELHRAVFDAAFHVALLLSDVGGESLSQNLFGWREGMVAARGCYLAR